MATKKDRKAYFREVDREIRDARADQIPEESLEVVGGGRLVPTPACLQPHEVESLHVEGLLPARKEHLEACDFCRLVVGTSDVGDIPVRRLGTILAAEAAVQGELDNALQRQRAG